MYENIFVVAENFYCFPALLEIVFRQRYGVSVDQKEIGRMLGVAKPIEHRCFDRAVSQCDDMRDWGVHVDLGALRRLFESMGVSVDVQMRNVNSIFEGCLSEVIKELKSDGSDVICGFSYGELYGIHSLLQCGHVALVLSLKENGVVEMYDPGPKNPGVKDFDDLKLFEAMRVRDGFLLSIRRLDA